MNDNNGNIKLNTYNETNEDKNVNNDIERQIIDNVVEIGKNNGKKLNIINKRIDFDKRTYMRLETMIPIYKEEIEGNPSESEVISYIIKKALDKLFIEEFKKKIEEL